jgi:hypothetical protein
MLVTHKLPTLAPVVPIEDTPVISPLKKPTPPTETALPEPIATRLLAYRLVEVVEDAEIVVANRLVTGDTLEPTVLAIRVEALTVLAPVIMYPSMSRSLIAILTHEPAPTPASNVATDVPLREPTFVRLKFAIFKLESAVFFMYGARLTTPKTIVFFVYFYEKFRLNAVRRLKKRIKKI